MESYAVIGLGRFGYSIAQELMAAGCEVLAIDLDEELVQRIADSVTEAVVADARDEQVLHSLGIRNYDCGIVAIGSDVAASILITMLLKEAGIAKVVCKASDEIHKKALLKVGADRVVIPEKEMAGRVARGLANPNVMDYIELSGQFAIVERSAPESWIGKSLKDLNVRNKYGLSIIAFRRGRDMIVSPRPDEPIARGDVLIVLGREDDLARLKK